MKIIKHFFVILSWCEIDRGKYAVQEHIKNVNKKSDVIPIPPPKTLNHGTMDGPTFLMSTIIAVSFRHLPHNRVFTLNLKL